MRVCVCVCVCVNSLHSSTAGHETFMNIGGGRGGGLGLRPDSLGSLAGRPRGAADRAGIPKLALCCLSAKGGSVNGCCWTDRVLWERDPRRVGREGAGRVGSRDSATAGVS